MQHLRDVDELYDVAPGEAFSLAENSKGSKVSEEMFFFFKILLFILEISNLMLVFIKPQFLTEEVLGTVIGMLIYKTVRSGAKCIASLYCYKLSAICKIHAVVV